MKHLRTFENFVNEDKTNELIGQKFLTGHDKGGKEIAKQKILSDIETGIKDLMDDPDNYAESDRPDELRAHLTNQAKENNWKGSIKYIPSAKNGLTYLTYVPGKSGFQSAVQPMAAGTEVMGTY
jgi:hypothetical protein